jgi:hypothetical protein
MGVLFRFLVAAVLLIALGGCAVGDEKCCVGHVRGCVDDLELCRWQCDEQGAGVECYVDCIDVVDNCAMDCEDE